MTDKDFCTKILEIAKQLNDMAETAFKDSNEEQYDISNYLCDITLDKYEIYKKYHNL